jgi:hypothetical protein
LQDNLFKDPIWLSEFLERMEKLMIEVGLKNQQDFNERIGTQRALTRWKTRESTPSLKSCIAIKQAFGKSLDWIIFGEEPSPGLAEFRPTSYDARPLAPIEAELLNEAMIKVDEVLKEEKKQLRPEQKVRLITRIYNDCAEDRIKPDHVMAKRYLWLLS